MRIYTIFVQELNKKKLETNKKGKIKEWIAKDKYTDHYSYAINIVNSRHKFLNKIRFDKSINLYAADKNKLHSLQRRLFQIIYK